MSYISRNRSYQLIQANSIAVLSSIAFHFILLGVILPQINLFAARTSSEDLRKVKITRLNPIESTRLPNFNPEPIAPSEPIKPQSPSRGSITSIYPDLSNFETKINLESDFNNSRSGLSNIKIAPLPIPVSRIERIPPPPPVIPPIKAQKPPRPTPSQKPVTRAKIDPIPTPRTKPETIEYPLSQAEIRDFRQRILQAKIRDRVDLITKNPTNTTNKEALQNYITWLLKIGRTDPEKMTISGTYPQDICARKLETTVVYGVFVNEVGKAIDLHLIKSSGYKIFDRQAETEIKSQTFKQPTDRPTAYQVDLNFKHSDRVCPALRISS